MTVGRYETQFRLRAREMAINSKSYELAPGAFLARLDQLDSEISVAENTTRKKLYLDRERLLREYAKLMDESRFGSFTYSDGRIITPSWSVDGFARQKSSEASDWLASKGIKWDGSPKSLRREIAKLLESGASLPSGAFGLHVSRTITIRNGIPSRTAKRIAQSR